MASTTQSKILLVASIWWRKLLSTWYQLDKKVKIFSQVVENWNAHSTGGRVLSRMKWKGGQQPTSGTTAPKSSRLKLNDSSWELVAEKLKKPCCSHFTETSFASGKEIVKWTLSDLCAHKTSGWRLHRLSSKELPSRGLFIFHHTGISTYKRCLFTARHTVLPPHSTLL